MSQPIILLVDDEVAYAKVVKKALENFGVAVIIAKDSEEALHVLQHGTPDLILLDVMMPEVDGLTFLRWLREHSDQTDLPIHVVSAKVTPADKEAALQAGANGYLTKPFMVDDLREVVSSYFPLPALEKA